jgi:hypothetical protein
MLSLASCGWKLLWLLLEANNVTANGTSRENSWTKIGEVETWDIDLDVAILARRGVFILE